MAEQVLPHVKVVLKACRRADVYSLSVAQVVDLAAASAMVYPMAVYPGEPFDETGEAEAGRR
ncbi:MAG: hypothetical protein U0559_09165 [Anaerolineae bacterium]